MTEKKLLNLAEAVKLAEEVVAGREDYVYVNPEGLAAGTGAACVNWDVNKNQPSCVVGHILHKFGVPVDEIVAYNDDGVDQFTPWLDDEGSKWDTSSIYRFLSRMQLKQDLGAPWGEALAFAKREIEWHDDLG